MVITGGLGFIGSNLAHRLASDNAVTIIDSKAPDSGANVANVVGLEKDCRIIEADLASPLKPQLRSISDTVEGASHVLHCASRTSHPASMTDPIGNLEANGLATLMLFEALRIAKSPARVIQLSTTSQTGPMMGESIDEEHPEFPRDIYSAHKSLQEKYALIYASAHGLDAVSLRLSNVYGRRAAIHSPALGFANYFIGLGLTNSKLKVFGGGQQRRSFLHIDDVLDAIIGAATASNLKGEVIQIANPHGITVRSLADTIVDKIGGRIEEVPFPPARARTEIGDAVFNIDKARKCLNWMPRISLERGLAETEQYFRPRMGSYLELA